MFGDGKNGSMYWKTCSEGARVFQEGKICLHIGRYVVKEQRVQELIFALARAFSF